MAATASSPAPAQPYPDFVIQPDAAAYFEAASQGRLLLKFCGACVSCHFYPRRLCPFCGSAETEWRESKGRGTIYSFTILRRGTPEPFAPVYVRLEEGPIVVGKAIDMSFESIAIGQRVRAVFVDAAPNHPPLLAFRPETDSPR